MVLCSGLGEFWYPLSGVHIRAAIFIKHKEHWFRQTGGDTGKTEHVLFGLWKWKNTWISEQNFGLMFTGPSLLVPAGDGDIAAAPDHLEYTEIGYPH